MIAERKRVLITGASGLIGTVLRDALADEYALSGVDLKPVPVLDSLVADMTDLDAILPAFEGVEVVIDLAANPDQDSSWETVRDNNIPSTYNALEAARRAGVKRLIFASSNHATGMYENDHPYSAIVAGEYDGIEPGSIEAPDSVRFAVLYGVSDNTWRFWDIAAGREVVGYAPEDNAEGWRQQR